MMTGRRAGALAVMLLLLAPGVARAQEPSLHVDIGGGVGLDLVLLPAGTFVQGSPPGEKGREDGETQREVRLSEPYYLGAQLVTVGQFTRFAAASGYRTEAERGTSGGSGWDGKALVQRRDFTWRHPGFPQGDDGPVTLVTYDDALAFTAWLSRTQGRAFTLPTEAQWEHAYRAGTRGAYYEGTTDTHADALALGWFKPNAGTGTHPVGQKKPNAFGLFDMAGNVFEWCLDWYAPYPAGAVVDPLASQADTSGKARRVLRGGSWLDDPSHGRAAARHRNTPGSRNADNGLRVAAAVAASPAPVPLPAQPPPVTLPAPLRARDPGPSCGAIVVGVGIVGSIGAVFAVFLIALLRLFTRPAAQRVAPPPIRFQNGADGFRIFAPPTHAGSTLHYRYHGSFGRQEGQVILEPSDAGQFIYTGAEPRVVEVVQVIGMADLAAPAAVVPETIVVRDDEDRFRGFPSAY